MINFQDAINVLMRMRKEYMGPQGQCVQSMQRNADRAKWLGEAMALIRKQDETITAKDAQIKLLESRLEAVKRDFESAAHNPSNLCEFCSADCVDAGTEVADTFQCGMFKYKVLEAMERSKT